MLDCFLGINYTYFNRDKRAKGSKNRFCLVFLEESNTQSASKRTQGTLTAQILSKNGF